MFTSKKKASNIRVMKSCSFYYFLFTVITVTSFIIRYLARDFISSDMKSFLIPWFNIIKSNGGLEVLSVQVGNYGLLYQTIIALFTYVNINPVYLYKILSVFFDYLLAASVAYYITIGLKPDYAKTLLTRKFCLVYAFVLFLPTVVMNSAFWGQCDSIYTFFLLWSVWFLYKERFSLSFCMLGFAFAFKLQSIFLLPLFVYFYFYKKSFNPLYCLVTLFVFWLSGIVAYFYGRNFLDGFAIYFQQIEGYRHMWMNSPSFWVFIGNDYENLRTVAIILTFSILFVGLLTIISGRNRMDSFEKIIEMAVFIEWTCMIFLPAMHERYTYVLDLLLLLLVFVNRKFWGGAFIAIATSCLTYYGFLFSNKDLSIWNNIIYILFWLCYSYVIFVSDVKKTGKPVNCN